jgi:hypothetical protein
MQASLARRRISLNRRFTQIFTDLICVDLRKSVVKKQRWAWPKKVVWDIAVALDERAQLE